MTTEPTSAHSAAHAVSEAHGDPLPAVHDEAADTPAWIPVSGLVALLFMLLWMLYRASNPAPEAEVIVEAPAAEAEAPAEAE